MILLIINELENLKCKNIVIVSLQLIINQSLKLHLSNKQNFIKIKSLFLSNSLIINGKLQ
nr:MAG TPA: hypothetical protein [Caudoviricetes sp.]